MAQKSRVRSNIAGILAAVRSPEKDNKQRGAGSTGRSWAIGRTREKHVCVEKREERITGASAEMMSETEPHDFP
jgi:hypothetical protein